MPTIEVPPDIVDKALVVLVDERRAALAVWKGRGRIDLYDPSGTWHEISRPYPLSEEGLWSRDDVVGHAAVALASAHPPEPALPAQGPLLRVEVGALCRASLVRASALGYALWNGREAVEVHDAGGHKLRTVRVPPCDLLTMSHLMHDILYVAALMARHSETPLRKSA